MPGKLNYNRPQFRNGNPTYEHNFIWTFTFGKFKGQPIESIPTDYLRWLRRTCSIMPIVERCATELERRKRIDSTHSA